MRLSIISPSEKELLNRIEANSGTDLSLWKISNLIIPFVSILISITAFSIFKNKENVSLITYLNLLVNGSIPMIALNRIGGMGSYLFKFDKSKEKQYGLDDTSFLRTKLFYWFLIVLLGSIFLYVYQVINNPFELSWSLLLVFLFSFLSVRLSIDIAKKVFLLHDKLIDKTFDQEVREDMENKGHGKGW